MGRIAIYPYKQGSHSAKALADALGCRVLRHQNSKFVPRRGDLIINWGSGKLPSNLNNIAILNPPKATTIAGNKLSFFKSVSKDLTVPWTDSRVEAQVWLDKGNTVVVRTVLTGHSGIGIQVTEPGQLLINAPLYTKYVPKDSEWRVHFMQPDIFYVQRKIKNPEIEEPKTWKIRNHDNGFIFQHDNLTIPESVIENAKLIMKQTDLHFGAIDIVYNRKQNKAFTLEINTAPGLEGVSLGKYKDSFLKIVKSS